MADNAPHGLACPTWGFSASPLVLDAELRVNRGRVLSIDKEMCDVLWRSEDCGDSYGTPTAFNLFYEGHNWTRPILVNGIIYCRSSKGSLVARDHRVVEKD